MKKIQTTQNCIHEGIKSRLNSRNAYHNLPQNPLSSSLLSKTIMIKMGKSIILPVVLYGCKTWSLTLMEKERLRMSKNTILRKISGPKGTRQRGRQETI